MAGTPCLQKIVLISVNERHFANCRYEEKKCLEIGEQSRNLLMNFLKIPPKKNPGKKSVGNKLPVKSPLPGKKAPQKKAPRQKGRNLHGIKVPSKKLHSNELALD